MTTAHLDPDVLATLRDIMGEDQFPVLVHTYLSDSEHRLAQLLAATDARALRDAAHSFKGSSCNMGAAHLAQLCGELEHLPVEAPAQWVADLQAKIVVEFTAVREGFLAILDRSPPP